MKGRRPRCAELLALLFSVEALCEAQSVEQEVSLTFDRDGSMVQTTLLRALIEGEPLPWSPPPLTLRDHETLEEFSAVAVDSRGVERKMKGVRHRTSVSMVKGTHHSELATHWFELPTLHEVTSVAVSYSVRSTPMFPEGAVVIPRDGSCRAVRIEVPAPPQGFRYRVSPGLHALAGEREGSLVVVRSAACDAPSTSAPELSVMSFAWGEARSWHDLGRLYEERLRRSAVLDAATRDFARTLLAGGPHPAEEPIHALFDFVRSRIRYVAVEVREGWYVPTPPAAVLARGWGDCKEKALLLVKLLEAAGIEAHLALVDSEQGAELDQAFPRLSAFNHVIVAVASAPLEAGGEGEWIFLDPTLPPSESGALHPLLLGRTALVLRSGGQSSLEQVRRSLDSNGVPPSRDRVLAGLRR